MQRRGIERGNSMRRLDGTFRVLEHVVDGGLRNGRRFSSADHDLGSDRGYIVGENVDPSRSRREDSRSLRTVDFELVRTVPIRLELDETLREVNTVSRVPEVHDDSSNVFGTLGNFDVDRVSFVVHQSSETFRESWSFE